MPDTGKDEDFGKVEAKLLHWNVEKSSIDYLKEAVQIFDATVFKIQKTVKRGDSNVESIAEYSKE